MVNSKFGYIIHIQFVEHAAGWDEGEYIIYRNGKWDRLREPDWFCAAEGLLPEGYSLDFHSSDNYLKIDLKTMSIKIPVEKKIEGMYTPTHGYVIFNLTVEKNRFGIIKSKYIPGILEKGNKTNNNKNLISNCEKSIEYLKINCYDCEGNSKDLGLRLRNLTMLALKTENNITLVYMHSEMMMMVIIITSI